MRVNPFLSCFMLFSTDKKSRSRKSRRRLPHKEENTSPHSYAGIIRIRFKGSSESSRNSQPSWLPLRVNSSASIVRQMHGKRNFWHSRNI